MVYWGTDYLRQVGGFAPAAAATVMSAYLGVAIGARVIASRAARIVPSGTLLVLAGATALAGVLLFWRGPGEAAMLAGLVIAGLGIANLYPLGLATNLGLAAGSPDTASARVSLGGGLAIFTAPLALGALADHTGLRTAYGVVPVMLGLVAILVLAAGVRGRRGSDHAEPMPLIGT